MKTTLNKIRAHSPCTGGWEKLLTYLGKTKADDEPLAITTILDSNGIEDAIWCLRAVEGYNREIRLFAVWCARQVQHLMTDKRSIDALDTAERYANGQATQDELNAVRAAARDARAAAAMAAWDAAAAVEASRDARAAAWFAADAVAAARSTAMDDAWDAAEDAARDDAWDYAMDAARDAEVEMLAKQESELRRICEEG